jgi:2-C-methyl-D-erythritol 2,4-cyclodiphosphate synthase
MDFRIGQGIDFHKLDKGLELWLGGILIPSERGTIAHSDGDVLIHSVCDALLGAAGLRDIGYHFPDTDNKFKDIDSKILLKKVIELVRLHGYTISNIDSTICLENPKLSPHIESIRNSLSKVTGLEPARISVKATTSEKMGFTGREKGIAAIASVLLYAK